MSVVVVGIDGSDESMDALQLAAREARLRQAPLRVVHSFEVPLTGAWSAGVPLDPEPYAHVARQLVDDALTALGSELEGIEVERVVEAGSAASVILENAKPEDLVVVGSRGLGGFKGLLLGSVSHQVVSHATGPVLVVRGRAH